MSVTLEPTDLTGFSRADLKAEVRSIVEEVMDELRVAASHDASDLRGELAAIAQDLRAANERGADAAAQAEASLAGSEPND